MDEQTNDVQGMEAAEKNEIDILKEEIKRFTIAVMDSSVKKQEISYAAVTKAIYRVQELPESFIRGLIKLSLSACVSRYSQKQSYQLISRLLDALAKHDSSAVARHLATSIIALFPILPNISKFSANSAILPAKWLLKYINATSNDNIPIIIEALGTISFYVALSKKAQTAFLKTLKTWKMPLDLDKRIGELAKEVTNQEKLLCLISFLSKVSSIELSTICLELFSKVALISKTRPAPSTLSIAHFFLEKITDLLFKDPLFLNIKKALLRAPEIAIYGIRVAIASVPLNMDIYADEIVNGLSSSLNSGDGEQRDEAVAVVISLASKCSPKIVGQLTNKLFDSLGVAKSVEQRVSLLNGIGGCSSLSQTGEEVNKLAHEIIQKTAKADKETNEATVSAYWKTAGAWALKMTGDNLASLSLMLKEASKLSSGLKYIGYGEIARIVEAMRLKSLPDDATKTLILDVDSKDALEAVAATLLILETNEIEAENFINSAAKFAQNEGVFKDKTLASMKPNHALLWVKLVKKILETQRNSTIYPQNIIQSLTLLLFWPHWEVRKEALKTLGCLLKSEGTKFGEKIAESIYNETISGNLQQLVNKNNQQKIAGETYVLVTKEILTVKGDGLDRLAVHTLLLASLPHLVEVDGSVWLRWIHSMEREPWEKSENFRTSAINKVLTCKERPVRDNALITLVALNIPELTEELWKNVEKNVAELSVKKYNKVTEKEVAIYKTAEGQLYNMNALDFDEGAHENNMKRENKAYSYQEQMQEMQLRRELAEKKRKEGKLTAKQKQVMEKELANEQVIREEISELYKVAEAKLDEVRAMVLADHHGAFLRSPIMFDVCLPLTRSHLISTEAARLFLAYRDAAFPHSEDYLGELLGSSFLRVIESKWNETNWTGESLPEALKRTFGLLNERAFVVDTGDDDFEDESIYDDIVGAPQLTFLYPFIKTILTGPNYSEALKVDALSLLQNAIHKRFLKEAAVLQLPMLEFADLLLSYYAEHLSATCLQALIQLVSVANETENTGERVLAMVRGALSYLENDKPEVRESVIKILSAHQLITRLVLSSENESFVTNCLVRLFIASHDGVQAVSNAARELWLSSLLHIRENMALPLVDECVSPISFIRESASIALATFIGQFPGAVSSILTKIEEVYTDLSEIRGAVFDEVGRMQKDAVEEWERRSGIGLALGQLAQLVDSKDSVQLIKLVVPNGLNDRRTICRESMCSAAVETIKRHGKDIMGDILPFLENLSDTTPSGADFDNLRQGLVVLIGTLAQYLDPSSDKVKVIVSRLMEILNTPSQSVQESVASCLPPLVPAIRSECRTIIQKLQTILMHGKNYGERRGAAYGIAGLMKGLGMYTLKEFEIMEVVQQGISDKKNSNFREGALLCLEIMCTTIGKLFEPYIIQMLPSLLVTFADNDNDVRKAADDTAKAMMTSMSSFGTKLILPTLTKGLEDDSWRTKCAATELLGSMAFCAPRQLSACLPSIVPHLTEVLVDSSSKVQKSGEKALQRIAMVVRNPEILGVTNQLMTGLLDPANKTSFALQAVLNTKFIHYIDAPSLALLMPIVRRAFEDRNSETRRVAAQIIANIYNLTEHKDMEPYLINLVPGVQKSLLDPVPEIRTVSARALGAIVAKSSGTTSEKLRDSIIPWLKEKLVSPQSTVDRSGAAQGLCEVLAGVGTEQLDYVMPEIIQVTEDPSVSAETRDGYILMYIYLPMTFGERFVPYLPKVVPPILKALADENEYVRASALKAGQRLISQYCSHARKLLLPQLQEALMDDNWRIRHASVQLIGDFLFTISGVTGKSTTATANEDDTMGMEQAGKTIIRALGQQCRDRVVAGLYLARSDVALVVRQAAGHVWKIVVANTPRTLKEVMKVLFEMVVASLASACDERQQMGARCLGELVRKMGDKIIQEILPILEQNQKSEDVEKRVGVAVALHEIIDNMSKDVLNHYLELLVTPVKASICDSEAEVRSAAATTFSVLYNNVGHDALDDIITPLLEQLTPEQDHILEGLCEVMKMNSRQMLPYLLPRLTKPPINVHALCSLASVAGDSLSRQLPRVLDALLNACTTNDQYDPMIDSCEKVVIAVADEEGIPVLTDYLLQRAAKGNVPAAVLLHTFVEKSGADLSELYEPLMTGLIQLYASESAQIVDHAISAAIGVSQQMDQRELQEILPAVKKSLNIMVSQAKGKQIPGFTHPKSLQPMLNMLREGVLQGGVEMKALAGETLGMVVSIADPVALKTHVVNITGPLIRVLGDRYPANVKLAILDTLSRLLDKVDAMLRPFLPQLQSTFVKALQEPSSRSVRLSAAGALSRLLRIHPKPEPLVLELLKFLANSQDEALIETTLIATRALISGSAAKLTPATFEEGYRVCELIYTKNSENSNELEVALTQNGGALLGEIAAKSGNFGAQNIFKDVESSQNMRTKQAKTFALQQIAQCDAEKLWSEHYEECKAALLSAFTADPLTASAAVRTAGKISIALGQNFDRELLSAIARTINHQSIDVRRATAVALTHYVTSFEEGLPNDILKAYRNSVEGAAKTILDEVHVSLRRVVKHGDLTPENLYNLASV